MTATSHDTLTTQPAAGRGERLYPRRGSRIFWAATSLRVEMDSIASDFFKDHPHGTLVDFGCGNMPYRPLFEEHVVEYLGFDLPGNELADRIVDVPGELAIETASVATVLSSQVLEHVAEPSKYLQEAYRVLGAGGLLILSTHGVWHYHPDPCDFWRWTSAGLRKEIERVGFQIARFRGIMGPEATALQLLQDATLSRIPFRLRSTYTRFMQWRIRRAEERCISEVRDKDASVYIVVARKAKE